MDVSYSMNSIPTGGDSKLVMMKQAAQMVVDFLREHAQTSDRMGLVWFTDNASEYTNSNGVKLLPLLSEWSDLKNQIVLRGTGTCTAMGAGLQTAFNTLSSSTQNRFAILLTDGMQNIEPKVTQVGSHLEIIDSGGWLCGGHSNVPANPDDDITTYNVVVHTIGVGITATYRSLLQDIANATNGFYLGTNDPATDLDLIYFVDLCNCLAGGSPAIVHHHAGTFHPQESRAIETFQINQSVRKLTAILSWEEVLTGTLTFWLRAPDGSLLDLHQEMKLFNSYTMVTIYLPKEQKSTILPYVGEWEMIVNGETSDTIASYRALIIAEDRETHLVFTYPRKIYEIGDIVPLHIHLEEAGKVIVQPSNLILENITVPVPVPKILARYRVTPYQLQKKIKVISEKYKLDPLEMKLQVLANDPRFQKQLQPIRKKFSLGEGTLDCKIIDEEIIIPILLTTPGLNTFRITAYFETKKNGPIQRLSMASIHVDPGKPDQKLSTVKFIPISKKEIKGVMLHVVPRNRAGNLLGPGRGNEFRILLEEEDVEYNIEDQLDGTYWIEVLPEKKLLQKGQIIRITFQDKVLWEDTIK